MEQSPDVIVITVKHEEEVIADRADLLVAVRGSSLVTGRTALRKAKEISELVAELEKCGVSSSATYQLRIRCRSNSGISRRVAEPWADNPNSGPLGL